MKKQIKIITTSVVGIILLIGVALFIFYPGEENETELIIHNGIGEANPASGHCSALGYTSRINETEAGQQGICIFPDGTECDRWAFYRGKCGQEWSYCSLKGYDLKNLSRTEGWFNDGSVCLDGNTGEEIGNVYDLVNAEFISQNK